MPTNQSTLFGIIDSSDAVEQRGEPATLKSFAGGYTSYGLSAAANGPRQLLLPANIPVRLGTSDSVDEWTSYSAVSSTLC